jgi:hypothetical protein
MFCCARGKKNFAKRISLDVISRVTNHQPHPWTHTQEIGFRVGESPDHETRVARVPTIDASSRLRRPVVDPSSSPVADDRGIRFEVKIPRFVSRSIARIRRRATRDRAGRPRDEADDTHAKPIPWVTVATRRRDDSIDRSKRKPDVPPFRAIHHRIDPRG